MRPEGIARSQASAGPDRPGAPSESAGGRGPKRANARIHLVLAALAVPLCGCVYLSNHTLAGACSDALDSPVRNFCVVAPGAIWRGERPTSADAKWLVEHGVGSIVSLQLDDQRAFETAPVAADLERSVAYFPVTDFDPLQNRYVRGLTEERQADIRRQVAEWKSQLRPAARIECRRGHCSLVRSAPASSAAR
jgi:hypothetical protein